MRNKNPNFVIHYLIERKKIREICRNQIIDKNEIEAIIQKKIRIIQKAEKEIESKGYWKRILFKNFSYHILIKEGKNEQEVVDQFIEKLKKRI